jgi:hypothetical protein
VIALREANRVAGLVLIEVPVEGTPVLDLVWFIRKHRGRNRVPNELGHLWHYCVREWNRVIAGAGLTVVARHQYLLNGRCYSSANPVGHCNWPESGQRGKLSSEPRSGAIWRIAITPCWPLRQREWHPSLRVRRVECRGSANSPRTV